ncbi:glycosyltransferase involved in cell wall biosynthesis [Flavobacterium sp. CG_23.5]|uniref:glycosyltransferase n=1 Tax=Flavobacterium sp. CG_23.5 TaxID=2760708 RepID=UPI001AE21ACB|nr:glycosyltransferase [Flavobacterium sp. CG_23.5]MBP2283025.1 glycosyltransferase involved in cell wall biosynthesis [Flavobacterium sp. CG_23.5]
MTFVIITHVPHLMEGNRFFAYGPYVREMNIWSKQVNKLTVVAPKSTIVKSAIDGAYEHPNIEFIAVENFDILSLKSVFRTVFKTPKIAWKIVQAMKKADHIHLRCPGNIGLLGCLVQIVFPNKPKTAKYAGNWDPKFKQPLTYQLQKWILSNTFLTRNMKVLVYGEWQGSTKNIKSFFTASYYEAEKTPILNKEVTTRIYFIFVGTLVLGKNPLYAIQLVEVLSKKGYEVHLDLYGEGIERAILEKYISAHRLEKIVSLKGNQTSETIKSAYQKSHFVVLPSDSEGWPKVVAEGMFWGCIPLATPVSCVPFMLDYGKRGLLLQMDIEMDLKQILTYISNKEKYTSTAISAQKWSQQYTLNLFEQEINKLMTN